MPIQTYTFDEIFLMISKFRMCSVQWWSITGIFWDNVTETPPNEMMALFLVQMSTMTAMKISNPGQRNFAVQQSIRSWSTQQQFVAGSVALSKICVTGLKIGKTVWWQ